jgi:allophanate hydrolase
MTPAPSPPSAASALPSLALDELRRAYAGGALDPAALVNALHEALARAPRDPAWISLRPRTALLADAAALEMQPRDLPLWGVPFAVKDNIDAAGLSTTAACPAFAYTPSQSAPVVARLLAAGALLVGKTNLDQFATGLVGTRSPYGAVPNAFDPSYISGGSSSGSASVVARGLVSFALGTDTAGSGRVPAGLNNLVGLKPTRGWLPTRGVVPACRSLDCVSIFALTCGDAAEVAKCAAGFDATDPYSRRPEAPSRARIARIGVARPLEFFGDGLQEQAHAQALDRARALARALGIDLVDVDASPLLEAARLLYEGPWIAERYAAIRWFFDEQAAQVEPSVRSIVDSGRRPSAADAFAGQHRLAEYRRACESIFAGIDAVLVPTAPAAYRIDEVNRDPLRLNARLGTYTNFVNLLDLAAIALPAGFRRDGIPFGVTLIAPAWSDAALLEFGARWQHALALPLGATGVPLPDGAPVSGAPVSPGEAPARVQVAVVGAHLSGMPLNGQLTERGAICVADTTTSADYRLHALPDTTPPKPGLARVNSGGAPIAVEVWDMPLVQFGSFVALVPPPLAIGSVQLGDGRWVKGFVCEAHALEGARDITSFGGWRRYLQSVASAGSTSAHPVQEAR